MNTPEISVFQIGGGLPADSPTYVERAVDSQILKATLEGQLCYVLTARQLGKSSLCNRTLQKLRDRNIACIVIDVSLVGTESEEPDTWFAGLAERLNSGFDLMSGEDFDNWWRSRNTGAFASIGILIEKELLDRVAQDCVIFFDEIDSLLGSRVGDSFFTLLRSIYDRRASQPHLRRLTFVLIGVASPSELISNRNRSPFNIGRAINMEGFRFIEAESVFAPLLASRFRSPLSVLGPILGWTGGQPFLTQKCCSLALSSDNIPSSGSERAWVDELIQKNVLTNWETQDEPVHLRTIRDRILESPKRRTSRLLALLENIQRGENVLIDDSGEQMELRLAGVVVEAANTLHMANRVYAEVFNLSWIRTNLERMRPYAVSMAGWIASERSDRSFLLRGKALADARSWASGRPLTNVEFEYLDASAKAEMEEAQKALRAEREANSILREARKRAERRVATAAMAGFCTIGATLGWSIHSLDKTRQTQAALLEQNRATQESLNVTESKLRAIRADFKNKQNELAALSEKLVHSEILIGAANNKVAKAELASRAAEEASQIQIEKSAQQTEAAQIKAADAARRAEEALDTAEMQDFKVQVKIRILDNEDHVTLQNDIVDPLVKALSNNDRLQDKRMAFVQTEFENSKNSGTRALLCYMLYRSTKAARWRDQFFALLDNSDTVTSDLTEATWEPADFEKAVLQISNLILSKPAGAQPYFDELELLNGYRRHALRTKYVDLYLNLVMLANEQFESNARFLRAEAPTAYLVFLAERLTQRGQGRHSPSDSLRDLSREMDMLDAKSDIPTASDPDQWRAWLARNKKWVDLWLEPGLRTIRSRPELIFRNEREWLDLLGLEEDTPTSNP